MLAVHGVVGCPCSSRSVEFRTEIGPVPRRDRSSSAPRSVEFRTEIGSGRRIPAHLKLGEHYATQGDLLGDRVDAAAYKGRNECGGERF